MRFDSATGQFVTKRLGQYWTPAEGEALTRWWNTAELPRPALEEDDRRDDPHERVG